MRWLVVGLMAALPCAAQSISVEPDWGVAGEFGTWTVTYTVGPEGMAKGGGIRVQLPDAWHAGPRNSANPLQSKFPEQDHYVSANSSNGNVTIDWEVEQERQVPWVKYPKNSLDGRYERYVFVTRATLKSGSLSEGDTLSIVYGDTSQGSSGCLASAISAPPLPVLGAVDRNGNGEFELVEDPPTIEARPGRPVFLSLHAPAQAQAGRPMEILATLEDKEFNGALGPAEIKLFPVTGAAELPDVVEIPAGESHVRFTVTPQSGVLRIKGTALGVALEAVSNPAQVSEHPPLMNVYWGDLHSHSKYSWDGVGEENFEYARDTAGLDFYAMTDHSMEKHEGRSRGLHPGVWGEYTAKTDTYHDPGEFVTLHAYECSFGTPYGHHIVYFRGEPGPLMAPGIGLPKVWEALTAGEALTIPHHTGKFPKNVDFSIHHERFRRNFELYSGHGLSESFDPTHPLAFEQSLFTSPGKTLDAPSHYQDALQMSLVLSVIAASDDHRSHPGLPHYGLAAVRAPKLTRDAIFQALYDRWTYATSGQKILLSFEVNGSPMGLHAEHDGPAEIVLEANGTDTIELVELLRWQPGDDAFSVTQAWVPGQLDVAVGHTDADCAPGSIYYARLKQTKEVRGRIAMAWSSPVWIE